MKGRRRLGLFLATSMLLSACTVGPNYQPDRMKVPAAFKETEEEEHPATPEEIERTNKEMTEWWSLFKDPILTRLVEDAIKGNYDLQIAGQRILAERAIRDRSAAQWYPQMDANMAVVMCAIPSTSITGHFALAMQLTGQKPPCSPMV